jgi:hypothetical protein
MYYLLFSNIVCVHGLAFCQLVHKKNIIDPKEDVITSPPQPKARVRLI